MDGTIEIDRAGGLVRVHLAELDIDLAAITQAGGWKQPQMPLQYAEKINAARSGNETVDCNMSTAVASFGWG
jgi:hypothetical protein